MTASISENRARAVGAHIHRQVVAEGGMLAHYGNGSRFVKRDAATGEWTSACLSDGVKALIRAHRAELRVYAAERRREMDGRSVVDKLSTGYPPWSGPPRRVDPPPRKPGERARKLVTGSRTDNGIL